VHAFDFSRIVIRQ